MFDLPTLLQMAMMFGVVIGFMCVLLGLVGAAAFTVANVRSPAIWLNGSKWVCTDERAGTCYEYTRREGE